MHAIAMNVSQTPCQAPAIWVLSLAAVMAVACSDKSEDTPVVDSAALDTADMQQGTTCTPTSKDQAPGTLHEARPAKVFVPDGWDGCQKWPLIVLLHGYSANGLLQDVYLGISQRVTSHGFVLVLPEGTPSKTGKRFWNATDACCDFDKQNIDDVRYLRDLLGQATDALSIDKERVYLIGHSNGGFMGYRMACEAADLVAGVASIAGAVTQTEAACAPTRPVNTLQIHGTADAIIPFDGAALYPSAQGSHERWVGLNACLGDGPQLDPVDYDPGAKGDETTRIHRDKGKEGTRSGLWKMQGSSHIPGFNDAFRDAMIGHVLAWRRNSK